MRAVRGPALLIEGDEIVALRGAVALLIREARTREAPVDPKLFDLFEDLRACSSSVGSDQVQSADNATPDRSRWVSTSAAAELLGVSESYLARLARSGRLVADRPDGWGWTFDPDSIERYRCAVEAKTEPHA